MSYNKIKTDPLKTILVITIGFLILYFIFEKRWMINLSVVIGTLGILSNYFAKKIDFLWMKMAVVLSYIIPNILLAIIYFLLLTPIALISRIFNKNNQLFLKNPKNTLFKEYNRTINKDSFKNPW